MREKYIDVVLAFSFGHPAKIESNELIAAHANFLRQIYFVPLIAQRDVPVEDAIFIDAIGEMEKSYVSTFQVIQRFSELAKRCNWKYIMVVAAPCHVWRCIRDLECCGFTAFNALAGGYDSDKIFFDKNSTQWWTRNRCAFWLREICIRLTPWWLYKKITGDKKA